MSPIIGYSQDFELLQFVYDLTMWSRIGGGKNACAGLALRLVLKGETFSPLYWKTKHQALIDMQRQCGFSGALQDHGALGVQLSIPCLCP